MQMTLPTTRQATSFLYRRSFLFLKLHMNKAFVAMYIEIQSCSTIYVNQRFTIVRFVKKLGVGFAYTPKTP